jgi:hypothetical protein
LAWAVASALRVSQGPLLAPLPAGGPKAGGALVLPWPEPGTLASMLAAVEQVAAGALLRQALAGRRDDPASVAQALGLSPRGFARVLREHGISLEDE